MSSSWKFLKIWEIVSDWRRPRRHNNCGREPPSWPPSAPSSHGTGLICVPTGYCGHDMWFLKLGHKRLCTFNLTFPGRSQLSCCEAMQATLWRDPPSEELRPLVFLWVCHLESRTPRSEGQSPGRHHDCTSSETLSKNYPDKHLSNFQPTQTM